VQQLVDLRDYYQGWRDSLPASLGDSATADALRTICEIDLSLLDVEPTRGFGRDAT
jgi:hypothetical protein